MGQREVCDYLETNPGWHETKEIVEELRQGYKGVQVALANAARAGYLEHQRSKNKMGKEWRLKRHVQGSPK
jgi:hypothetical protein